MDGEATVSGAFPTLACHRGEGVRTNPVVEVFVSVRQYLQYAAPWVKLKQNRRIEDMDERLEVDANDKDGRPYNFTAIPIKAGRSEVSNGKVVFPETRQRPELPKRMVEPLVEND